jgi:voltage-gated potassium channel Kch
MKHSLGQRLRYRFDSTLARGPAALVAWLAIATITLILLAFGLDLALGGLSDQAGLGPREVLWNLIFQSLVPNPPGNFDSPFPFLVIMLLVTLISLGMVSILIGLLSAGIQNRIEHLRRGRSQIIEQDHTVILGWSEQIFIVVAEIVAANINQRRTTIAILGDHDQVEMEDQIRHRLGTTGHTHVVCRRGSPIEHADLDLVSPQTSRAVIILPDADQIDPDAETIKTILALTHAPDRRPEPYTIAAVLHSERHQAVAQMVGGDEVQLVLSSDVIARLIAQTCRQAGLSLVYSELMSFEGNEIYIHEEPALVGRAFGDVLLAYEDAAVIGIAPRDGHPLLGPQPATVIAPGDRLIAIAQNDAALRMRTGQPPAISAADIVPATPATHPPERTLILGWNRHAPTMVCQLDAYVPSGSTLTIIADHASASDAVATLTPRLHNQQISYEQGDPTDRVLLNRLDVPSYQHVVVLCASDSLDPQRADSLTLVTLLHLRQIADTHGHPFSIVSEMMDVRNRSLAESARADDFIVSERLISQLAVQVAENTALVEIFHTLLDPAGAKILLKPACLYVSEGVELSFATVVEAARRRDECAVGFRIQGHEADRAHGYGMVLNPPKSRSVGLGRDDRVIVVAKG